MINQFIVFANQCFKYHIKRAFLLPSGTIEKWNTNIYRSNSLKSKTFPFIYEHGPSVWYLDTMLNAVWHIIITVRPLKGRKKVSHEDIKSKVLFYINFIWFNSCLSAHHNPPNCKNLTHPLPHLSLWTKKKEWNGFWSFVKNTTTPQVSSRQ